MDINQRYVSTSRWYVNRLYGNGLQPPYRDIGIRRFLELQVWVSYLNINILMVFPAMHQSAMHLKIAIIELLVKANPDHLS